MTQSKSVKNYSASIALALALAALSLASSSVADPETENDGRLTEGSAAHTMPGGAERQAQEPTTAAMPQQESPLTGIAPLDDVVDPMHAFSNLDLNRDGVLTSSEAHASSRIGNDWRKLDTNDDGVIDRSEWSLVVEDPPPTAEEANR